MRELLVILSSRGMYEARGCPGLKPCLIHDMMTIGWLMQASPGKKRSKSISDEEGMAGVELLAQAIDSVIMRVQVLIHYCPESFWYNVVSFFLHPCNDMFSPSR